MHFCGHSSLNQECHSVYLHVHTFLIICMCFGHKNRTYIKAEIWSYCNGIQPRMKRCRIETSTYGKTNYSDLYNYVCHIGTVQVVSNHGD